MDKTKEEKMQKVLAIFAKMTKKENDLMVEYLKAMDSQAHQRGKEEALEKVEKKMLDNIIKIRKKMLNELDKLVEQNKSFDTYDYDEIASDLIKYIYFKKRELQKTND